MSEYLYEQKTGKLFRLVSVGYSGHDDGDGVREPGEGKNDPSVEYVKGVGPIPHGWWTAGPLYDSKDHGPAVHVLTPDPGTDTKGRDHFLMHGDSVKVPGSASLGCMIQPKPTRVAVENGDRVHVVHEIRET